jgi:hypothetical protein
MNKNFKRGITTVLTSAMLISSVPSYAAAPKFKDVPAKHWAYSYVENMAKLGYLSGYDDGTFKPGNNLTFMESMSTLSRLTNPTAAEKNAAKSEYKSLLDQLKVEHEWARDALSIALYKDIVSKDELVNANDKGLLNKNINKITVSVFVARTMGLEEAAKSKTVVFLPYKDTELIEASQRKYVDVLLDAGVLDSKGEGDGKFNPKSTLTRQVMATMLSNASDYIKKNPIAPVPDTSKPVETEIVKSTIKRITDELGRKYLVIEDRSGNESGYLVENTTPITIDGKTSDSSSLAVGQDVELTIKKGTLDLASVKATSIEEVVEGIVKYINSSTSKMTLEYMDGNKTLTKDFTIDKNAKIYLDDKVSYLSDIKTGDTVTIRTQNSIISDIEAKAKIQKIEGIVKEIVPIKDTKDLEYEITIVDSKDISHKFKIDSKTYIYRNNKTVKVTDLKVKDNAYIISEYGIAQDIDAKVVKREIKGYIVGINNRFNQNTLVTIRNTETNKEEDYELTSGAYIRIDNKPASALPSTPGYYVEIVLEGDEIVDIYADSSSLDTSVSGKIDYIDTKNNIIEITKDNINFENDGFKREATIYVSPTAIVTIKGAVSKYGIHDLRKGDKIITAGTYQGANYVVDTIIVR